MSKQLTKEESAVLLAAMDYAEVSGVPLNKVAWCLGSLFNCTDSTVFLHLKTAKRLREGGLDYQGQIELHEEAEYGETDENLEKRVGDVVRVQVVAIKTYGALCAVENSTKTLLLHVSELADEYIDDVNQYIDIGDTLFAMLILSKSNNRLALSSKRIGSVKRKMPRFGYEYEE